MQNNLKVHLMALGHRFNTRNQGEGGIKTELEISSLCKQEDGNTSNSNGNRKEEQV